MTSKFDHANERLNEAKEVLRFRSPRTGDLLATIVQAGEDPLVNFNTHTIDTTSISLKTLEALVAWIKDMAKEK
jgi:hypothetical protein